MARNDEAFVVSKESLFNTWATLDTLRLVYESYIIIGDLPV